MKHPKSISQILFYLVVGLVSFSLTQAAGLTPVCFISDRSHKYHLSHALLIQYSSNGERITSQGHTTDYVCPDGFKISDYDLIDDGQNQLIGVLFSNRKATWLEICDLHTGARILLKNMTLYHPWKILFSDVDRDSIVEVCLGVYKQSPLHPLLTKRLFIYNFDHGLQPKWLGSRLAHPFTDFGFMDTENRTILISIELKNQGRPLLNAYEWDCFGFIAIQARFNTVIAINNTTVLNSGYILENTLYRRVLFTVNQNSSGEIIDMDLEETNK